VSHRNEVQFAIEQQIVSDARGNPDVNVTDRVQTEVTMQNRLIVMPALIWGLRSDSKLLSGIRSLGADLLIAMREALPNAPPHGYQSDASKRLFVSFASEANEMLLVGCGMKEMSSIQINFPHRIRSGKTRRK
jgi:hypothetical protein